MAQREATLLLRGVVLPTTHCFVAFGPVNAGRGSENKAPFIAAFQPGENGHSQHVRFDPIPDYRRTTFRDWAKRALHPDAHLVRDGCASFNAAGAEACAHGAIIVGKRKSSELEPVRWVNTFIPTPRPRSRAPITTSTSTSTAIATWPRRSIASTAVSTSLRWSDSWPTPARIHSLARKSGCAKPSQSRPERWR
jgi:hypothetical protein